ncbi:BMP family ABC transporter substrate-binding protein [Desulforhopalus sp. 52FAK]
MFTILTLSAPISAYSDDKITVGFMVGVSGLGDQSYNDMAYAGLFKVKKEHDIRLIFEDSKKDVQAFESSMQRLIQKGSNIIVANGFYMQELVEKYAKLHPKIYFILQDATVTDLENVVSILYSVNEGSFLAGAFAALMTKSRQVGFIGGVDIPIMHMFSGGFTQGVHYINSRVSVKEQFISTAPDFSGFKNPAKAHTVANEFYNSGIDIIFSAAGLSGNGVIQAAKETGKFAIGVDSDQDHLAKGNVLTSMMKRLDIATYTEVKKIIDGNLTHGVVTYGLAENGVGLSPMKFTHQLIPESVMSEIDQIKTDIINGKIKIQNH